MGYVRQFYRQILVVFVLAVVICLYLYFRESTLQECVLNHIKNSTDDSAALVYQMCEEKYPEKPQNHNYFELSQPQLSQLTGRAGPTYLGSDTYEVNLYNGNQDLTISEVTVLLTATAKKGASQSREYKKSVYVAPKSASVFTFGFIAGDEGSTYSWVIAAAKGYKD